MAQPWLKFYPRDWRGDQALRSVSVAARGLWIECLCIMHEAKPYGHLMLNGNPVEDGVLARMAGIPVDEVSALLAELRQAGVFSVTGRGVIFSRRMTNDHARACKGRKAIKKRWSQVSGDVEQSDAPNRSPIRSPSTQKPEARSQRPPKSPKGDDGGFEAFYAAYPRHEGKGHASRAYKTALGKASAEILLAAAQRFRERRVGEDPKFTPLPASWLNGERWTDEPTAANSQPASFQNTDERGWRDRIRAFQDKGMWHPKFGPKPGEPGCKCPAEILDDGKEAA
jgi:hypothetical protein